MTWRDLTGSQRMALQHPALIAEECAHPRYARRTGLGTVVLTVNAGYE
jgi:hypothetical protein